ncbi:MAG TPA: peptidylprolyl isomerase [Longimicrobium sp.]|nr:peptidylprolyl isomerase [Longimicrobium sp.]
MNPMRRAALAALVVAAGCAPAAPAGTASPRPAARSVDVDATARLLRIQDRREYDAATLELAATSPNPGTRRRAALAAGQIHDRRALPLLARLLADTDTSVAASAAFAIGQVADSGGVALLVPVLDAGRVATAPTVVGEAAQALGKLRTTAARQAVESFLLAAPRTGPGVREAVGPALLAVYRFPRPADAAPIVPWLQSGDTAIRWRAAYALTRRPDPRGSAALFAHATDPDPLVRSFAVRSLTAPLADSSGVGQARALPLLLSATSAAEYPVSVSATRALGTYTDARAIARLVELLRGDDAHLAITAAESLGRLATRAPASAAPLRDVAIDPARPVALRTAALAALAEVARLRARGVAAAFASNAGWRLRAAAARAYAELGDRDELAMLARDRDGRVGAIAIEAAVGAAGDSAIAPIRNLLIETLGARDVIARTNALVGLTALADPATLPLLLDAYDRARADSMNDAALAAVDALGALAKKDSAAARSFFARFPRSSDYLVRQRAATAFGASTPWGAALPVEGGSPEHYRRLAAELVAPEERTGRRPRARIVTNRGTIEVELFAADAPGTVNNFLTLARSGYFDGQEWPRVVANFVIQGGDPRGDTSGGPGYAIRDEINRHLYGAGTLGMALSGPDTGGSQWFISHSPQPHLDGTYAVFGQVVSGMDVVNRVVPGDRIVRIEEVK